MTTNLSKLNVIIFNRQDGLQYKEARQILFHLSLGMLPTKSLFLVNFKKILLRNHNNEGSLKGITRLSVK